jgi:hypothetical protein
LQDVGAALSDGTNLAELEKLGDLVSAQQEKLGSAMTAALVKMLDRLTEDAKKIEALEARIRNR